MLKLKPVPLPTGYQHTMCVMGVSLTRAAMNELGYAISYNPANTKMVQRVERWLAACTPHCKEHKLSQGAKRDLDKMFITVGAQVDAARGDNEKCLAIWSAVLSAANLFVFDAYKFAHEFTKGKVCWRYLDQTTYSLVQRLAKICPEAENQGWQFYLDLQVDFSQFRKKDADGKIIYEFM